MHRIVAPFPNFYVVISNPTFKILIIFRNMCHKEVMK